MGQAEPVRGEGARCKGKSRARKVLGRGASRVRARTSLACLRSQEDWGLEAQQARTVQKEGGGERAGWAVLSWGIWLVLVGGSEALFGRLYAV